MGDVIPPDAPSQRQPTPVYRNTNGFVDPIRQRMAGAASASTMNLHTIAAKPQDATKEELRELRNAVQRRQVVENMMELGGMYFPG